MKRAPIGKYARLILLYAVCVLVVLAFVGVNVFSRAVSAYNREVVSLNLSMIAHSADMIESQLITPVMSCAATIAVGGDMGGQVWNLLDGGGSTLYSILALRDDLLARRRQVLDSVSDIRIYDTERKLILSSRIGLYYPGDHNEINRYKNAWIGELTFSGRRWLTADKAEYPGAEGIQIPYALSLGAASARASVVGYIVVDLNESALGDLLRALSSGEEERLFVIDENGRVLSSTDPDMLLADGAALGMPLPEGDAAGVTSFRLDGAHMMLCYSAPMSSGWRVCRLIGTDKFYASSRAMQTGILIVLAVALIIGMMISVYFSRRLYRPVHALTSRLSGEDGAGQGSRNEYEFIDRAIESMRTELVDMRGQVEADQLMVKNYLLVSLFNGATYSDEALASRLRQVGCPETLPPCCTVVRVTLSQAMNSATDPERLRLIKLDILNRLENCGDERTVVLACEVRGDELAAAVLADSTDRNDMLERLCLWLMEQYERHVEVSVGGWQTDVRSLHAAYETAVEAQRFHFFHPDWLYCAWDVVRAAEFRTDNTLDAHCAAFVEAVSQRDLDGANRALHLFAYEEQDNIYPYDRALEPLAAMTGAIVRAGESAPPAVTEQIGRFTARCDGGYYKNIREYVGELCQLLYALMAESAGPDDPQTSQQIRKLEIFISQNLHRDLSLTSLADYVGLSSGYLSRLFKKETGENLVDYITVLRLERARQLLEQTDESIEMISRQVGYPTHHYFSRKFKERFGRTPRDYRQKTQTAHA